ncbi:MAG: deoxyhypusine synthase [Candidatus Peregrinibacteria bacterium Greene0416_19]|nr:MAG: deoxyhypusine synthase [Candidatus Peregrinibacteria bacterium Greene0416_19]
MVEGRGLAPACFTAGPVSFNLTCSRPAVVSAAMPPPEEPPFPALPESPDTPLASPTSVEALRQECPGRARYLLDRISQKRIDPPAITAGTDLGELIEQAFLSYNAGRLREACKLYAEKMLADDVVVGVSLAGALTPAGLGKSSIVPLINAGFIDWIVSTGANLYHDTHFALGMEMHQSRPGLDDHQLRDHQVIRIYDIVFDAENLYGTDRFYRTLCRGEEFQKTMGTPEFHNLVGKYLAQLEDQTGRNGSSLLAAAYRAGVPIFTSSPGDSSIGMNLAALQLEGSRLSLDPLKDVNDAAAIVFHAKQQEEKSAVMLLGGGSPKNFLLQTEPQIQEVLGLPEAGHDYFLQVTDARPDTGGLSGATPQEAMTWGKVDPAKLPDTVTCYLDTTVALPLMTAYALRTRRPRTHRRLMDRLPISSALLAGRYRGRRFGAS